MASTFQLTTLYIVFEADLPDIISSGAGPFPEADFALPAFRPDFALLSLKAALSSPPTTGLLSLATVFLSLATGGVAEVFLVSGLAISASAQIIILIDFICTICTEIHSTVQW